MTKTCSRCKQEKSTRDFYNHRRDGLTSACKICLRDDVRKNFHQHSMIESQYTALLERQDYRCLICQRYLSEGNRTIDHDHNCCPGNTSCGKCVRGILCKNCNAGLGMFKDNPVFLLGAVRYLQSFEALYSYSDMDSLQYDLI